MSKFSFAEETEFGDVFLKEYYYLIDIEEQSELDWCRGALESAAPIVIKRFVDTLLVEMDKYERYGVNEKRALMLAIQKVSAELCSP